MMGESVESAIRSSVYLGVRLALERAVPYEVRAGIVHGLRDPSRRWIGNEPGFNQSLFQTNVQLNLTRTSEPV